MKYLTAASAAAILEAAHQAAKHHAAINGAGLLIDVIEGKLDQAIIQQSRPIDLTSIITLGKVELARGAMLVVALMARPGSFDHKEAIITKMMTLDEDDPWMMLLARLALTEADLADEKYYDFLGILHFRQETLSEEESEELEVAQSFLRMAKSDGYRLTVGVN